MPLKLSRRDLLATGAAGIAAATAQPSALAAEADRRMHLGIVTYNVAKDWDFDTILKNCKAAGIEGVEFRTTHKHGVEPEISSDRRKEIKQQCADAGLLQTSLGSICEFQSTDAEVVRSNIDTCRDFILLAKDIG